MTGLKTPWETARLPDGGLLVTERGGTLRWLEADGTNGSFDVAATAEHGDAGLLGMAVAPDFETSRHLFLFQTVRDGDGYASRVIRYVFDRGLSRPHVVLSGIPADGSDVGGRIAFGPDGMLYVATGDAGRPPEAQDARSLAGKILRIAPDGGVPQDNPFGNAVWALGFRDPQGIAWDGQGRLWATDHGSSGQPGGFDELDLVVKGGNYGWPLLLGDETSGTMIPPARHSGVKAGWDPAGIAFADGDLHFAGLSGTALYKVRVDAGGDVTRFHEHFRREFGRLRSVRVEGAFLYVTTSNREGGVADAGDDRVLRIRVDGLD
jgi:glucose/arabinose dehydrogenase